MERDNQHYPLAAHPERKFEILAELVELLNLVNFGSVRPATHLALQLLEFVLRACRRELNAAILAISDPSSQAEAAACDPDVPPEADSLHPS